MSSSSPPERFFAPCPRGLEALLAAELKSFGAARVEPAAGGVGFGGSLETCYRANLWSRLASRILWRLKEFPYRNEGDLYAAVKAVNWPRHFTV